MKITLVLTWALMGMMSLNGQQTEDLKEVETRNVIRWQDVLIQSRNSTNEEKIKLLWPAPRSLGQWMPESYHSPDTEKIYQEIVHEIMSIPGYITYFTDELDQLKESVKDRPPGSGRRHDYDRPRAWYIRDTFPHLPAPETIKVIGGYLNDDYDVLPKGEESSGATPPNSDLASFALAKIGLLDPPPENLAAQRKWWEEVKSGQRTFAFLGKPVSYRFLPDGKTETTSRDASRDPRRFPPPLDPGKSAQPPAVIRMPWIIGGVSLLLLGVLGYFLKRKIRA